MSDRRHSLEEQDGKKRKPEMSEVIFDFYICVLGKNKMNTRKKKEVDTCHTQLQKWRIRPYSEVVR